MKVKNLLVLLSLTGLFGACNKDKVTPKSKKEILVQNSWQIEQTDLETPITTFTIYKKNASNNLYDASKISLSFKNDGTILATDQSGKSVSGNWSFNADETKITLPDGLPFKEASIETLSEKNFNVSVANFKYDVLGTSVNGTLVVKMVPKF